jgi:hypothetical protein
MITYMRGIHGYIDIDIKKLNRKKREQCSPRQAVQYNNPSHIYIKIRNGHGYIIVLFLPFLEKNMIEFYSTRDKQNFPFSN